MFSCQQDAGKCIEETTRTPAPYQRKVVSWDRDYRNLKCV